LYAGLCTFVAIIQLKRERIMGIVIGIDVGGSTTKIVGVEDKKIKNPMFVKATDPVTSLFGAFGKYIYDNNISLSNIEKVILTGVGSAYIDQPLYGLPTAKTDEFLANGLGAQYNTGLDSLLVVSMGTPSSRYKAPRSSISGDWVSVAEPSSACLSYY
jgi:type II pantothenate kinase